MILITTAGKVGSEAARLLTERGAAVRVLVRDARAAAPLATAGVELHEGDLADAASIDMAMNDVTSMILVSPPVVELELNAIDSAVRAKVGHVVKITSKASTDSTIARRRDQTTIEQSLTASGLPHTLLRNNGYMQNFLMLAPQIAATGGFGSSAGDGQIGMIDVRDVAATAAEIALAPARHAGHTYWPTGPELLIYPDTAAILSDVLGRSIVCRPLTFEQERRGMIAAGLPERLAEMNAQAIGLIADGDSAWITDDVPRIIGRPARSFRQFVTDHAAAFTPSRSSVS